MFFESTMGHKFNEGLTHHKWCLGGFYSSCENNGCIKCFLTNQLLVSRT